MDNYKLYLKYLRYTHRGGRCGHTLGGAHGRNRKGANGKEEPSFFQFVNALLRPSIALDSTSLHDIITTLVSRCLCGRAGAQSSRVDVSMAIRVSDVDCSQ